MKKTTLSRFTRSASIVLAVATALSLNQSAQAGTLYYDGGTNTWVATAFSIDAAGSADPENAPGLGDDVIFNITSANAVANVLSLGGNQSANSLTFSTSGTTLINSTAADQTLTLGASGGTGITVNTGAGLVTIGSATVAANRTNVILGTAGANQSWTLNGATSMTVANGVAGTASGGNTQTLTLGGSSTGSVTFTGNTTAITDGSNGGKLALVVNGSATGINSGFGVALSNANSYTGGTTITRGRVTANNIGAFGATNSLVTVQGTTDGGTGGQAFLGIAGIYAYDFNISGFGNNESNNNGQRYALRILSGATVGASTNTLTIANAAAIGTSGTGSFTIASKITGTGALTIREGGTASQTTTATFTNADNDYSGTTTLTRAILQLNASTAARNSIIDTGAGTTNVLTFGNGITAATIGGLAGTGSGSLSLLNNTSAAVALTLGNNNNTGMSYSGTLTGAGGSLIKTGTGTQTLSGASTFTGNVTINNGVLVSNGAGVAATSGPLGVGTTTVNTNGELRATAANALLGSAGITLAGGTLRGSNAATIIYGGNVTVTANSTVINERSGSASSTSMTETFGTLSIGANTLNVTSTNNQTGGTAGITFGATTLTGASTFNITNNSNATDTTLLTLGAVTTSANNTLTQSGNGTLTTGTIGFDGASGTTFATSGTTAARTNIGGVTFASGSSAMTVSGSAFTLTGNITNSSAAVQTIGQNITLSSAAHTINNGVTLNGNITTGTGINGNVTFAGAGTSVLAGTNSFISTNANGNLTVNTGATLNITGATTVSGTGASGGQIFVGSNTASTNTVTVATGGSLTISGTTNATGGASIVGQQSVGILNVNGTLTHNATGFYLGNSASNQGTGSQLNVGAGGLATFATGAAGTEGAYLLVGRQGGIGTTNLNGGTLETGRTIARNGATATDIGTANFNFNGGTLRALANNNDWLASATTANAIGANSTYALTSVTTGATSGNISTIDANGYAVAINNSISGNGGFIIANTGGASTGVVTFGGANTYSGSTVVSAGSLAVNNFSGSATGNGSVTVNTSGTLLGAGTINAGSNSVTVNGHLAPGVSGVGSVGTLSITGALTLSNSSSLDFDINSSGSKDLITLGNSSLTISGGLLSLTLGGSFDYSQTYTLFSGASSFSGGFGSITGYDSTNYMAATSFNAGSYDLSFTPTPVPEPSTWVGAGLITGLAGWSQRRRLSKLARRQAVA